MMSKYEEQRQSGDLKALKNNDNKDWEELQWIQEFYEFLQGRLPESLSFPRGHSPKLSKKKAYAIIYYLQEHMPLIPDQYEQCSICGDIYDSSTEGIYWESKCKFYCGACEHLNYDKGKR